MKRNYPLLLASQILGALGDQAILAVILGQLTFAQNAGRLTPAQLSGWNAIYSTLLFIPYVVLAPLVGYWNDRHAKTRWLAGGNLIRLGGTALAATSVWLGPAVQGLGYLLVGVGACAFSPAKYGILPEIVARHRLVKANGWLEFFTIAAILAGFVAGAALVDHLPVLACYGVLLGIYATSLGLNLLMAPTPRHPEVKLRRSVDAFFGNLGQLLGHPRLFRVLCGLGLFWFCGAAIKMNFQPWGLNVLLLHEETVMVLAHPFHLGVNTQIALLGLWLSLGVMLGTMTAGALHRVGDLRGLRPYGWALAGLVALLGLADGLLGLELARFHGRVVALLVATGTMAGLFLVPLTATLQSESDPTRLGKTLAAMNFVDNLGMVLAGGVVLFAAQAGIGASGVFILLGIALGGAVVFLKVPRAPRGFAPAESGGSEGGTDPGDVGTNRQGGRS
jgi:LPLT family lysophospholipid transporter-like MFS transporter